MHFLNFIGEGVRTCNFIQPNLNRTILKLKKYSHKLYLRKMSTSDQKTPQPYIPFLNVIRSKIAEANRSILVQVQSQRHLKQLESYCQNIGLVNKIMCCGGSTTSTQLVIVEFSKEESLDEVYNKSLFKNTSILYPVRSRFFQFNTTTSKSSSNLNSKINDNKKAVFEDNVDLNEVLQACNSISDQMITLYQFRKLNEFGSRVRYLIANQIQQSLKGMFPYATAYPFGSSVNGFGKMGCDLDIIFHLNDSETNKIGGKFIALQKEPSYINSNEQEKQLLKAMTLMADIFEHFLPGCVLVRRIFQARVPIIKFYHEFANIQCDVSMSNMSGVHMSDLLYMYGSMDSRVRPLVFTIREWAKQVNLTNSTPGEWITNFSLTLLVLSFLQQRLKNYSPILPPFKKLSDSAGAEDEFVIENGINCTFLRNIDNLKYTTTNNDSLESLLIQFFEYYSNFNFYDNAISLNIGVPIKKPTDNILYIVNPLERDKNVARNVRLNHVDKFQVEAQKAASILNSENDKQFLSFSWNRAKLPKDLNRSKISLRISTLFENDNVNNVSLKNK